MDLARVARQPVELRVSFTWATLVCTNLCLALISGCTASVVCLHQGIAHVANVGDSRVVGCHRNKAVVLTRDHTGNRSEERARIEALGGEVSAAGRVRGKLMVTCARHGKKWACLRPDGFTVCGVGEQVGAGHPAQLERRVGGMGAGRW